MAYNYLRAHKALDFLDECYAAEHTLSLGSPHLAAFLVQPSIYIVYVVIYLL